MSLARTIISLCLLRGDDVLNDKDTQEEAQSKVWADLKLHYSTELITLLQKMMAYNEGDRPTFADLYQVR